MTKRSSWPADGLIRVDLESEKNGFGPTTLRVHLPPLTNMPDTVIVRVDGEVSGEDIAPDEERQFGAKALRLTDDDLVLLWIGALDYYLPRSSYAPPCFCEILEQNWTWLPAAVRTLAISRITEAIENGRLSQFEDIAQAWTDTLERLKRTKVEAEA